MYFLTSACLTNYNRVLIGLFVPGNYSFQLMTLYISQQNILTKFVVFDFWSELNINHTIFLNEFHEYRIILLFYLLFYLNSVLILDKVFTP